MAQLTDIEEEWNKITAEYSSIEALEKEYTEKANNLQILQGKCSKAVAQHQKKCSNVRDQLKRFTQQQSISNSPPTSPRDGEFIDIVTQNKVGDMSVEMADLKTKLANFAEMLPVKNNGVYLNTILGSVNVSITQKQDRYVYKDEYEKFKLTVTSIALVMASICLLFPTRFFDAAFNFLLVWYYCTLTIRESILRVNGSRIKGWWVAHHYISAFLCGIFVTWPDGECYQEFRRQFLVFSAYICAVQILQCFYQRGCLYRLRSLGQRYDMDVTVEGFHSWMFKGLSFLLVFLFLAYIFQFYNAYVLVRLMFTKRCTEWQVPAVALLFLVVAVGNTWTTLKVVSHKITEKDKPGRRKRLVTKYSAPPTPNENGKKED